MAEFVVFSYNVGRKGNGGYIMEKQQMTGKVKREIWRQRIGYGFADFACNLIWQMISLYLLYFYTDVMDLNEVSIALMFVVCRVIDAGTDLLIGYCIDKTHTKWGKSRPYFLFGAAPFAIFAVLAFSVPDISPAGKLVYAYVTYIGLSFMYTVVNIPMASILPSLTASAEERTALSTSRKFFGFLGASVVSATALKLVDTFGGGNEALGFRIVMIIFGIVGCAIFFFTFASVRERVTTVSTQAILVESLKSLAKNKPWIIFALNVLVMWGGFFIQTSAIVYYYKAVIGSVSLSVTVATIMSVVPMAANFFVPAFAKRLGKRNLYVSAAAVQLAGLLVIWAAGMNHMVILAGAVVTAFGYGVKESIYFSMQADPVDYGEWKTGINTAGSLSAINGFLGKVAQAAAGGIGGLLLAWGGYEGSAAVQSANAVTAIRAMYLYIPMILLVCSIVIMMFYNLDKIYPQIKRELEQRQQNKE